MDDLEERLHKIVSFLIKNISKTVCIMLIIIGLLGYFHFEFYFIKGLKDNVLFLQNFLPFLDFNGTIEIIIPSKFPDVYFFKFSHYLIIGFIDFIIICLVLFLVSVISIFIYSFLKRNDNKSQQNMQ